MKKHFSYSSNKINELLDLSELSSSVASLVIPSTSSPRPVIEIVSSVIATASSTIRTTRNYFEVTSSTPRHLGDILNQQQTKKSSQLKHGIPTSGTTTPTTLTPRTTPADITTQSSTVHFTSPMTTTAKSLVEATSQTSTQNYRLFPLSMYIHLFSLRQLL